MRSTGASMLAAAGASCALAALVPAAAAGAEGASQTYSSTGEHAFVVPAGVTSVNVELVGASGGTGGGSNFTAPGGKGATEVGTLAVTPGEVLYVEVGGEGQATGVGGSNGGGLGGVTVPRVDAAAGGGGGASDVRTCSVNPATPVQPVFCAGINTLSSRLLVAAGGGGGGYEGSDQAKGGIGGPAGGEGNSGGEDEHMDKGGSGGGPGGPAGGGPGGFPSYNQQALPGTLGTGGSGGNGSGGGGGGGGIYGGGGGGGGQHGEVGPFEVYGAGGGGGGGSSGVPAGASGVSNASTAPTAREPSATFIWTLPPPASVTGAAQNVTSTSALLTGTVNADGSPVSDCHFTISPAAPAGGSIPCPQQVGAGSVPVPVSATLTGLSPGTRYTVTLVAASSQGSSSGTPVTFTTPAFIMAPTPGLGPGAAPTVTGVSLSPSRFRRGGHAATISRARPRHKAKTLPTFTTISFALSQPATVTLSVQAAGPGVLARGRCAAPTKGRGRARHCTRYMTVPGTVRLAAHAGADRVHFEGVLDGGRSLAPGSYRLTLTASAAAGATTAAQHPAFTLVR
jgi:hypothetical protein